MSKSPADADYVEDVAERTAALRAVHHPLDTMICFAVSDFKAATEHPQGEFVRFYGGIAGFEQQLFLLLDVWRSGARY
ncbi:hypothetical protein [Shewanella sp.]|uniref:hypothetical protein n=1 Tax=Shewanella sp. TaxID=50422 RepID=UPI003A889488